MKFVEQLESYNDQLPSKIKTYFETRKRKILKKNNLFAALDVPIHKIPDSKGIYPIPTPEMRNKINIKPQDPQPRDTNQNLQSTVKYTMKFFKYSMRPEKYLKRILILMKAKMKKPFEIIFYFTYNLNLKVLATGETFNKSGKTDILLKYEIQMFL